MAKRYDYREGMDVQIVDTLNDRESVTCTGKVERLTRAQVFVRNEHGNLIKFWKKNNRVVGYAWPHLTTELRPAPAALPAATEPAVAAAKEPVNTHHKSNQTLRKLRDRLTDIINENEKVGRAERNEYPVYLQFHLVRGRGDWYVPIGFASGAAMGLTDEGGHKLLVMTLSGDEKNTIKIYQTRAKPQRRAR